MSRNKLAVVTAAVGAILVATGGISAIETNTDLGSLPIGVVALSGLLGLLSGTADYVEAVRNAFERARWAIVGIAVFVVFGFVTSESYARLAIPAAIGFGGGVVVGALVGAVTFGRTEQRPVN